MRRQWYVRKGDKVSGPFTDADLKLLAKRGKVSPNNQLRIGEDGPWKPASDIPGLFPWIDEVSSPPPAKPQRPSPARGPSRWLIAAAAGVAALVLFAAVAVVCAVIYWPWGDDETAATIGPKSGIPRLAKGPQVDDLRQPLPEPVIRPAVAPIVQEQPAEPIVRNEPAPAASQPRIPSDLRPAPPPVVVIEPKPILPPIPTQKLPITDAEIRDFDAEVGRQLQARNAYALYRVFSQSHAFTEEQQAAVDAELTQWQQRADAELHRLGSKWVAAGEVAAAETEANQLIDRAKVLIELGSFDECIDFLEQASIANPNAVRADYILGLIYSLPFAGVSAAQDAELYFRKVLRREPDFVAAHNSLAVAQLKQGEYHPALSSLERAAELSPAGCQQVAQNLGRFLLLAETQRIHADDSVVRRATQIYSTLITEGRAEPFNERTGWLHAIPVFPTSDREAEAQAEPPANAANAQAGNARAAMAPVAAGSGFVVAPEFIMTNRHVVYDERVGLGVADAVGIQSPHDPDQELTGTVIAISDETDLAVVHVPGLAAPPVVFRPDAAELAGEVMILGFPRSEVLGHSLKATRGVISGLPDPTRAGAGSYYLFDAAADRGNSGGPVVDRGGRVVGVLTVGFLTQAGLTGGVTSEAALKFAAENVPDFNPALASRNAEAPHNEWSEAVAGVAPSVVSLTVYYNSGVSSLDVAAQRVQAAGNVYEDRTCPRCNGRSRLACPQRGCNRGEVSVKYYVGARVGAGVARVAKYRKEQCPTCDGHATLDCPDCVKGIDRDLR